MSDSELSILQALDKAFTSKNPFADDGEDMPLFLRLLDDDCSTLALLFVQTCVNSDNVNLTFTNGDTLISYACRYGNVAVAELLIVKGARYNNNILFTGMQMPNMEDFILSHFDFSQPSNGRDYVTLAYQCGFARLLQRLIDVRYPCSANIFFVPICKAGQTAQMEDVCLNIAALSIRPFAEQRHIDLAKNHGFFRLASLLEDMVRQREPVSLGSMSVQQYSPR